MSRPTRMFIDLSALRHNYLRVQQFAPNQSIIAMVKANAYGHGLTRVALALPMADAFGVASLDEGILLREAGIKHPIFLMEGLFSEKEVHEATQFNFSLVVHHLPHVEMLEKVKLNAPFSIWLKINTGMNRLGIEVNQFANIYKRLQALSAIKKPIGLMTHFAEANTYPSEFTEQQMNTFFHAVKGYVGPYSLANSAAIMLYPRSHGQWVRPGLMLYGASPIEGKEAMDFALKPVMTLGTKLIAIHHIKAYEKVGYGCHFEAPHDMTIGVAAVGYGDGYPQSAANGTPVLVNGTLCTLVGRVSMDMITIDLSKIKEARVGDPVVLWGENLPVEEVAKFCNTSPYEILTRMTPRPKIEIKEGKQKHEFEELMG